ncbi:hypothetical protein BO443_120024 [Burkholderia orbicola]
MPVLSAGGAATTGETGAEQRLAGQFIGSLGWKSKELPS